jgi:hypothetical protein
LISAFKTRHRKLGLVVLALVLLSIGFVVGIQYSHSIPEASFQPSRVSQKGTIPNKEQDESYWYKVGKPDVLPVWLAMLVTAGVGFIALETLGDIRKQTHIGLRSARAAKESAKAALLNAKAVINAERAWLVVGVEQVNNTDTGALPIYVFTCLNQGKTPATIKTIDAGYSVVKDPFELPVPVRDGDLSPRVLPQRTFIVSRDSFKIHPEVAPDSILYSINGRFELESSDFVMFYGRIVYEDIFPSWGPGRKPHETRWCYAYDPATGRLISTGPDEYNNHT